MYPGSNCEHFVGVAEFALNDSKDWARKCREAGMECQLQVEWGQLHVWGFGKQVDRAGIEAKDRREDGRMDDAIVWGGLEGRKIEVCYTETPQTAVLTANCVLDHS